MEMHGPMDLPQYAILLCIHYRLKMKLLLNYTIHDVPIINGSQKKPSADNQSKAIRFKREIFSKISINRF
jgi:hypothetical protein